MPITKEFLQQKAIEYRAAALQATADANANMGAAQAMEALLALMDAEAAMGGVIIPAHEA